MKLPPFTKRVSAISVAVLVSNSLLIPFVQAAEEQTLTKTPQSNAASLDAITVQAKRDNRVSSGATGLNLDIAETPQSISVLEDTTLSSFAHDEVKDGLRMATGVQVEDWETNRSNYSARGFEIVNTQIDGIGLPNSWGIITGAIDSYGYEKIEIIRGANGLLTGVGNSSGTLNYVLKRPTNTREGEVILRVGENAETRLAVDYNTPLNEDGTWAARGIAAVQSEESYLRDLENDRVFVSAIIDGQVGEDGTLTFGISNQDTDTTGNMWGALVHSYTDGTQAEFDTSASTTVDWTYWDTKTLNTFVEYTKLVGENWEFKGALHNRDFEDESQLFYVYSSTGIDPDTGLGLVGWPGAWDNESNTTLLDLSFNGEYQLGDRWHQAIIGVSAAEGESTTYNRPVEFSDPAFLPTPSFPYNGEAIAEPNWGERTENSFVDRSQQRLYASTNLDLTNKFNLVLGLNAISIEREGNNGTVDFDQSEDEANPYIGAVFELSPNTRVYASYSDIYQDQEQYTESGEFIDAMKGENKELGVKSELLDQNLLLTAAVFDADQKGQASFAGIDADGRFFYEGVDTKSSGFELEAQGRVSDSITVQAGFTHVNIKDFEGTRAHRWIPRQSLKLSVEGGVENNARLSWGVSGRWQDDIQNVDGTSGFTVKQDAYAVFDGYLAYAINPKAKIRLNLKNIADEKYITSLKNIGFYGSPRDASVTFSYNF